MPEMDGFEVVKAIREREKESESARRLPIIALTARSSARDREKALAAGMDDFLSKPLEAAGLWGAMERVTAHIPPRRRERSSLLDARAVTQMCGGRGGVLDRLCEVFRRSLPEQLATARGAVVAGDLLRLRVAAHMLAGTLSAFSTIAGGVASALEDAAITEDLATCATLVGRLESLCATLIEDTRGLTLEDLNL
jgi:CheY-like chemotaxis protein